MIAASFSDHFQIPFLNRPDRIFPVGDYYLFAPSRGGSWPIAKWTAKVTRWPLFSSRIKMEINWPVGKDQYRVVRYKGPIIVKGNLVISRLSAVRFWKRYIKVINANGQEVDAATSRRNYDPSFIVFCNNTLDWIYRPCVISGFSDEEDCYGGTGVLVRGDATLADEQITEIFKGCYFLDYKSIKDAADDLSHGALRQRGNAPAQNE